MMDNFKPTAQDQKKAENIRRQYLSHEADRMERLKKLDGRVKRPGRIVACILGVAGALVMGAGMSLVMVWENMVPGLALSIPGLLAALLAYPVYALITGRRRKKYAPDIMRLSDELIAE